MVENQKSHINKKKSIAELSEKIYSVFDYTLDPSFGNKALNRKHVHRLIKVPNLCL